MPPTPYSTVPGSTGRPLPEHVARTIGERLGVDLSAVRVFDDALANKAAAQRNVRAFAYGTDIYLGPNEQATDVELMAHEVAHVIQQAGRPTLQLFTVPPAPDQLEHEAQDAGAAVARGESTTVTGRTAPREQGGVLSWIGDRLEDIADWAEDRFWDLVDTLLPDWLARIIRKGLFTWLKEQITSFAQAAFDALMAPVRAVAGFIESVAEHFKNLVDWMRDAVAKLLRGDCSSIAEAAEKIWRVVEGIGMAIVNKVKDIVRAVGGFFKGIWDKYLSKVWDWMGKVAGAVGAAARAVWDTIKRVGEFLWDLTKPVRDIAGRVWRWLKRQIFGEESGGSDGKGGLLEWVKSKAEAAWNWLKDKLEPIRKPLMVIGAIVVALSPVGPVIAIGAAVVGLVKGAKWIGAKLRDRNSVIRERGYLRGVILPAIMGAVNAVWSAVSRAARFLASIFGAAVSGLGSAVTGLASSIFSFLSPLVGWILNLFKRIFAWASDAVGGLADLLKRGFDRLMAFLQPLFDVVGALVSVISDLLNIVKLIFLKAWHLIPACIRDPIVNFIRDQILKRIPIFSQLLEIPDIWTKVKETAFTIIRQIFRDGDIWGAAKTFFRAVLGILNVPLELVTGIFTKAWGAIDEIIRNPIRFLRSVLGAMWQGFGQFFKKILKYLLDGVLGWLTGQLKDAGIEAPTEWTFGALVKLVLSVLGVTLDKLWKLLGKKIGDPIVEKLKKAVKMLTGAWEWVAALISEGPAGLWKKLKEEVGQLKDMVIDAISGYLQSTIIGEASKKILTALNPVGAIINAIILAYNAIKTAAQYARQILEMVSKVLDAAADLAAGSVGAAANTIEWALGKALTIAIGFLANYLNLGGFGKKVADMVKKIQDRVEQAIEKIIDWAISAGRALLETLGLGKKKEEAPKPAVVGEYIFEEPDEGHTLKLAPDLTVVEFSTPKPASGKKTMKTQQDALEKFVKPTEPDYPVDALQRAAGPSGHIKGPKGFGAAVKDGDERAGRSGTGMGYQQGDHRGHLIGDRFWGPFKTKNYVPMNPTLNLSTFKSWENKIAVRHRALRAAFRGVLVHMNVVPSYPKDEPSNPISYRPTTVTGTAKVITLKPGQPTLTVEEEAIESGPLTNPGAVVTTFNINVVATDRTFLKSLKLHDRLIIALARERADGRFETYMGLQTRLAPRLGDYAGLISQLDPYVDLMTFE